MKNCRTRRPVGLPLRKASVWCFMPLLCAVLVFSGYCQTASQSPAAATGAEQAPNVSANVDEVSLDIVVHDRKNKPVLDLKPEDVVITDNNTPVKLLGFHLVTGPADGNAPSDHLVTMVFDHFQGPTARNAQAVAVKILKMLPSKGYSFALLDFAGRLRLIQGFTDDRNEIAQAVKVVTEKDASDKSQVVQLTYTNIALNKAPDKTRSESMNASDQAEKYLIAVAQTGADPSGKAVDVKVRARYQTLLAALEDSRRIRQEQHTLPTLAGLLALVKSQQKVSGRKSLIYFTQNMQMDSASKEMVKTVTGAASQAGVSVYVVDLDALNSGGRHQMQNALLNGQQPFNPTPVANSPYTSVTPMQQEAGTPIQGAPSAQGPNWGSAQDIAVMTDFMRNGWEGKDPLGETKSPLAGLAKNTGGAYIDAQDNVKKPLEQMLQDMTTYYEASYIPPIQEYDGSLRTISAKPMRAGLNVKTKTGYFALAPGAEGGIRPFEVPLMKVLSQPQLPTDVKFQTAILKFGDLPDGYMSTLAVEVPLFDLEMREDSNTNLSSAHVSIVAEIKDKNGTVIEHFGEDISRRGALKSMQNDKTGAITMQRHFIAVPGQYIAEVAVLDQNSEKLSAQRMDFEIPPVRGGPSLSNMVLARKIDSFDEETDPLEPLRYEKTKITPNLSGFVSHEAAALNIFLILHPDPHTSETPTLEMQVIHNGKPGRNIPLPLRKSDEGVAMPYLATFQSSSLSPGLYEVKAMMTQGGKTAEQHLSFTVEGIVAAGNSDVSAKTDEVNPHGADGKQTLSSGSGQLGITVPASAIQPPTSEEIQGIIADARERAINYTDSLPNFLCVEITNRSVDPAGVGRWKLRDTVTELLRYRDHNETRTTLGVNGQSVGTDRVAMKGTFSSGEFGGVLKSVFQDSAKADFKWQETDELGNGTVQVFSYHVDQANSIFSVVGMNNSQIIVGFHGLVFIDTATRSVRRITLVADDIPRNFPTHATSIAVDYDYVVINDHDYLVPVNAEVKLKQGRHEATLNTIEFRNFKRFGSSATILPPSDEKP